MKVDSSVHPSLFTLNGFHHPSINTRNRKGGGTAIFMRNHIAFTQPPELENTEFETSWAKLQIQKACIVICSCYVPPNSSREKQDNFLDYMTDCIVATQSYNPDILIVAGDVNGGNCWLAPESPHHSPVSPFEMKLKSVVETLSLTQLIDTATRIQGPTHNLRDIILIDNPQVVNRSGILPPFSNLDHFPVFASLAIPSHKSRTQPPVPVYDYANTDIDQLVDILSQTDWRAISEKDIDEAIDTLTMTLLNAADKCIPVKLVQKRANKPWVSSELRREMRKRDRLFRKARQTGDANAWTRWKKQRNLVTKLNRDLKGAKRSKTLDTLLHSKKDPHKYHTLLKDITGLKRKVQIPPLIIGDKIISEDTATADAFNAYFCEQTNIRVEDIHLNSLHDYLAHQPRTQCKFAHTNITPQEVLRCINKLDTSKACGPDSIPTKVLKLAAAYIAEPLSEIFNKSIREGKYPTLWKRATVKPVYKGKGSPSDIKTIAQSHYYPAFPKSLRRSCL